jgi:colicin import membrane protein
MAVIVALASALCAASGASAGDTDPSVRPPHRSSAGPGRVVHPSPRPEPLEEQRIIEEIDMLERARAEAEARRETMDRHDGSPGPPIHAPRPAEFGQAPERVRPDAPSVMRQPAPPIETRDQADGEAGTGDAGEQEQLIAEREAEADRIDAALRLAREARERRLRGAPGAGTPAPGDDANRAPLPVEARIEDNQGSTREPRPDPATGYEPSSGQTGNVPPGVSYTSRVTVLLLMTPGNRGIRRHHKTADPIICGERGCYVGAGADRSADLFPLRKALGPGRTLGDRAGACSNSLGCVFRDVDLVAYPAVLQPIDMRLMRHDRRQPLTLREASECALMGGALSCTPVHGPDYTMWIVPEEIAEAAGAEALIDALDRGLTEFETVEARRRRH